MYWRKKIKQRFHFLIIILIKYTLQGDFFHIFFFFIKSGAMYLLSDGQHRTPHRVFSFISFSFNKSEAMHILSDSQHLVL